jgi:hypothetical protein
MQSNKPPTNATYSFYARVLAINCFRVPKIVRQISNCVALTDAQLSTLQVPSLCLEEYELDDSPDAFVPSPSKATASSSLPVVPTTSTTTSTTTTTTTTSTTSTTSSVAQQQLLHSENSRYASPSLTPTASPSTVSHSASASTLLPGPRTRDRLVSELARNLAQHPQLFQWNQVLVDKQCDTAVACRCVVLINTNGWISITRHC